MTVLLNLIFLLLIEKSNMDIIPLIDKNGTLVKEKNETNKDGSSITKKYKYEKYIKKEFEYKSYPSYLGDGNFKFYSKNNFVFARILYYNALYLQKGRKTSETPYGEIFESNQYFETEYKGVELTRTIYNNENEKNNIDSLIQILKKMDYDTIQIGNIEYRTVKFGYKSISI